MKKQYCTLLLLCLICLLATSCAPNTTEQAKLPQGNPSDVDSVIEQNINASENTEAPPPSTPEPTTQAPPPSTPESENIDIDLTALSGTMVYAEVYNMMVEPDKYVGKSVKMSGPYYASYYDETDKYYHYVIIEDAAACCSQGLEFLWNGEHVYPDDYPEDQTRIEVTGIFGSYEELGQKYYCLTIDEMEILK